MRQIKQLMRVSAAVGVSLAFLTAGPIASASSLPGTVVQGHFQTATNPECTVPAEDCITDQLTGGLVGRNELTTLDYTETSSLINYHDQTVITVTGGAFAGKQFAGNEHGKINKNSGSFHSCAELTATDGSGDRLVMRYNGHIDLEDNHDTGHYRGVINGSTHCPWS